MSDISVALIILIDHKYATKNTHIRNQQMISRTIVSSAIAMLLASVDRQAVSAKESLLYDHVSSDVAVYNKLNFEKQVSKNRDKGISIVHFYKDEGK